MRFRLILSALILAIGGSLTAFAGFSFGSGFGSGAQAPARPGAASAPAAAKAAPHTVTLVNDTGSKVWIGSSVNPDGSKALSDLPAIADGDKAKVTIPENSDAGHWRGTLFARQGCTGDSGGSFRCEVGDCGPEAGRCTTGEQPVSLAEFNFDPSDAMAPWYDVSYVNAVSEAVTIAPDGDAPPADGQCSEAGCAGALLGHCPADDLTKDPGTGKPMLCVNPDRDAETPYSKAFNEHCPKAYAWSGQDKVPGNKVMRQCPSCSGLTVTFH